MKGRSTDEDVAASPEKVALTTSPNYDKMGHSPEQAKNYKLGLLDHYRKRREEGLVLASPRLNEKGTAHGAAAAK